MAPRFSSLRQPPIGFAHRGARANAPENTIDAFTLAMRLGATGLESDAFITKDGEVVLDHDGVVRKGMRRRPIDTIDRADLPDHIPTLDELYDACGTDLPLSLDVKDANAFEAIVAVARNAGGEDNLWLCHPDWELVASWRDLTDAKLVDSTRLSRMKSGPERRGAKLADAGIDAVNMHYSDWTPGLTTLFHRFRLEVLGWDAQQARIIDELLDMGIDGVFSDHVDRLADSLARLQ